MNNPRQSNFIHQCVRRRICAAWILLLLLLALPAALQAQFTYVTNSGTITITGYTGPGGAVTLPSTINGLPVTSIGSGAFYGYGDPLPYILTSVTIPNSVTNIGDYAFRGCYRLSNVTIGNSVTSIGAAAFYDCSALTNVTIPNSVTNIGDRAFGWCTSLSAITVDVLNSAYSSEAGVLYNKSQTTLIQCPGGKTGSYAIPNSVTNIGDYALEDCVSLTSVTIGNGVTSIGYNAFAHCTNLTSVTIPNSVTSIGTQAFGWTALTNVTIPSSVTSIDPSAFWDCSSLAAITVDALNPAYSSVDGVWFDKSQTTLIECPAGRAGGYTVPHSVTSIGGWAFSFCASLTSITIPSSVASIGFGAFNDCSALTSVTIPDSVTSIGEGAFWYCTSLSAITVDVLNSAYSSEAGVLYNKSQTTLIQCPGGKTGSYAIPNSVTSIGRWAFELCTNLTSVTIPNSVTSIGLGAFKSCNSLTNVTLSSSVTSIETTAFAYCISLTSITIPSSVTSIRSFAFESCTSLTSITIPNSVTEVGNYAFRLCGSLTGVHFKGNAPSLGSSVFDNDNKATVYYLPGTTGWGSTFGGRPTALWVLPTASNITAATLQDHPLNLAVAKLLALASHPIAGSLSITNMSAASTNGGSVVLGPDQITYNPVSGSVGADRFSYSVSDAMGLSASAYVFVQVRATNQISGNMLPLSAISGGYLVSFAGIPGRTYSVQRAPTVTGPWVTIATVTVGLDGIGSFQDTNPLEDAAFYRTTYP